MIRVSRSHNENNCCISPRSNVLEIAVDRKKAAWLRGSAVQLGALPPTSQKWCRFKSRLCQCMECWTTANVINGTDDFNRTLTLWSIERLMEAANQLIRINGNKSTALSTIQVGNSLCDSSWFLSDSCSTTSARRCHFPNPSFHMDLWPVCLIYSKCCLSIWTPGKTYQLAKMTDMLHKWLWWLQYTSQDACRTGIIERSRKRCVPHTMCGICECHAIKYRQYIDGFIQHSFFID